MAAAVKTAAHVLFGQMVSQPFEETDRGAGGRFGEFFERDAAQGGEVAGGVGDVGGLAAFAAMRDGREVGRVGFEHEVIGCILMSDAFLITGRSRIVQPEHAQPSRS